jgi:hypothetical protein
MPCKGRADRIGKGWSQRPSPQGDGLKAQVFKPVEQAQPRQRGYVGSVMTDGMRCQSPQLSSGIKKTEGLGPRSRTAGCTSRPTLPRPTLPPQGACPLRDNSFDRYPARHVVRRPGFSFHRRSHAIPPSPEGDGPLAIFLVEGIGPVGRTRLTACAPFPQTGGSGLERIFT